MEDLMKFMNSTAHFARKYYNLIDGKKYVKIIVLLEAVFSQNNPLTYYEFR